MKLFFFCLCRLLPLVSTYWASLTLIHTLGLYLNFDIHSCKNSDWNYTMIPYVCVHWWYSLYNGSHLPAFQMFLCVHQIFIIIIGFHMADIRPQLKLFFSFRKKNHQSFFEFYKNRFKKNNFGCDSSFSFFFAVFKF